MVVTILKQEKSFLKDSFGVEEIGVFGSYARGDAKENSDLDILVKMQQPDYSRLIKLLTYLEKKFNKKIDLVRYGKHLSDRFMNVIAKDIIYA